ncbi:MAG: helicase-exonuclease AddAB subunit AddA [Bacillota bacterium]
MTTWTREQEQAIYTRNCNLLVAAAAGSGKTAVLVERIIKLICDEKAPVDVDALLVVTFTNAAAAEMKERIGAALAQAAKRNPLSRHLYRQSTLLNKASIMTLHSFCMEVVKENFYILGIDPHFRIADETEAELLRLDVLEEILEKYYTNCVDGDGFSKLIDAYGGSQDDVLIQNLIIKLFSFAQSNPWPQKWLEEVITGFTGSEWFQYLLPSIKMEFSTAREMLVQAFRLAGAPGGPAAYIATLQEEIYLLEDILNAASLSWKEAYDAASTAAFGRLPRAKKEESNPELQEKVKYFRDKAKDILKGLQNKYFHRLPQDFINDLVIVQPYLELLGRLVMEFKEEYAKAKIRRNIMDFNDLEHYCLQLLMATNSTPEQIIPSAVSMKLQEKYSQVLVDEYQDINDVQETILQLVSRPDNLFMVGDVKQSIYRFRLARPELFQEKYYRFANKEGYADRRIDLASNFRCRKEIVDGVNFVFQQLMGKDLGEIEYNQEARLRCGVVYPECQGQAGLAGPVEFYLVEKDMEEAEQLTSVEREAVIIGNRIKELIEQNCLVFDKKTNDYRTITYSDIVILLRSPKGSAETFLERFRLLGIPVYGELGRGYFKATEVQIMLSLLKIIDNPRQDIPLAGVLRSPLVGLSSQEMANIRLHCPQGDFYQAILQTVEKTKDQLAEKLGGFLSRLENWRTLARQNELANLIWTLYRETGYFDYVGAMAGGSQRQANLRALHDRARQFETTSFKGLFMFLRFLQRMEENKSDLEAAKALSENENVVRIMSIHKSKGLEFPVVIIAGLGKKFNMLDTRQDITLHKDLGLGPVFIDPEKRIKYPTIAKLAIDIKVKLETLAEEMRILYVAMTRAREKLIMIGTVRKVQKQIEDWAQFLDIPSVKIPDSFLAQADSFLDWLGPALTRHRDGIPLRRFVPQQAISLLEDESAWEIAVLQEELNVQEDEQVAATREMLESIKDLQQVQIDPQLYRQVAEKLEWTYPFPGVSTKGAKVSVTEIKHKFQEVQLDLQENRIFQGFRRRPVFLQKKKALTAVEKGSAIHCVMQHIPLHQKITGQYLEMFLEDLLSRELLTPEQKESIPQENILLFFESSLGERLKRAQRAEREIPFSLTLDVQEIYDDIGTDTSDKVLLQGVIDCMWYEDGGWVLIDYKSDQIKDEDLSGFIDRYSGQINLYTRAVETITKEKVKERYLYLFSLGKAIQL